MSSRRKMVLKPLNSAALLSKEQNSNNDTSDPFRHERSIPILERKPIQSPAALISPNTEKKKILIQDSVPPITPTVQRNKVLLPCTINQDLSDTDDSDFDDSPINDDTANKPQKSNFKLYYSLLCFCCWAAVQYWMIAVAGFGAVFFALSALIAICLNTATTEKKRNVLSAYSVFNPQCTPIQGSADPKQLERELIFGGL